MGFLKSTLLANCAIFRKTIQKQPELTLPNVAKHIHILLIILLILYMKIPYYHHLLVILCYHPFDSPLLLFESSNFILCIVHFSDTPFNIGDRLLLDRHSFSDVSSTFELKNVRVLFGPSTIPGTVYFPQGTNLEKFSFLRIEIQRLFRDGLPFVKRPFTFK